jgi:hypothetical protein
MSSGLPVVAVAAGGLVDILRNTVGEAGALMLILCPLYIPRYISEANLLRVADSSSNLS